MNDNEARPAVAIAVAIFSKPDQATNIICLAAGQYDYSPSFMIGLNTMLARLDPLKKYDALNSKSIVSIAKRINATSRCEHAVAMARCFMLGHKKYSRISKLKAKQAYR